ncbi:heme-binding protein 1 isoform X3 [Ahaetulla prasina]|uniref:heme-binding protein 1 isoform X3 n=1 Tax=Ahaetulla prasina TaxID=499056 RepID=UPI002648EF6E|nr:heme-binding protein 1 isoform X3 [Ahaetulla prasina]
MFGMIRNSLFGTAEVWPCRLLSKGEKDDVAYEERTYEGGMFAIVELSEKPFDEALHEAVLKLLKYVGGSNNQGAGMGMMAPVCSTVFPAEDGSLQHKVKVLLRIPSQFQDNPPSPSDVSIQIEKREEMVVYSTGILRTNNLLVIFGHAFWNWNQECHCSRTTEYYTA